MQVSRFQRELLTIIPWMIVVALGVTTILSLPHQTGAHGSYDAYRYLAGAESLVTTGQYRSLSGEVSLHFPPGTSLIYAGLARLTSSSPESRELTVNLVAYLLTAIAVYIVLRLQNVHPAVLILVLPCILLNGFILSLHNKLWSEPPYLVVHCAFLATITAAIFAAPERKPALLIASAFLLGVGYVLRYAVVGTIPILAGVAALSLRRSPRVWLTSVLMLAAGAVPVVAGWFLAGINGMKRAPRTVGLFTPADQVLSNLWGGCAEFVEQMLPEKVLGRVGFTMAGVVLFAAPAVVTGLWLYARRRKVAAASDVCDVEYKLQASVQINAMLVISYVLYFLFIGCVELFVDPTTRFNLRILCPAYILLLCALAVTATLLISGNRETTRKLRWLSTSAGVLLMCVLAVTAVRAVKFSVGRIRDSVEVAHHDKNETLMEEVRRVVSAYGAGKRVVSNGQGFAWYALRNDVRGLDHSTWKTFLQKHSSRDALLLFRDDEYVEAAPVSVSEILQATGARTVYESPFLLFAKFDQPSESVTAVDRSTR